MSAPNAEVHALRRHPGPAEDCDYPSCVEARLPASLPAPKAEK